MRVRVWCRHAEPIRAEVDKASYQFHCFGESLNELMDLQRTWIRLDPVFSSADFQRSMPKESAMFADVSKFFSSTLLRIRDSPNAMQVLACLCYPLKNPIARMSVLYVRDSGYVQVFFVLCL